MCLSKVMNNTSKKLRLGEKNLSECNKVCLATGPAILRLKKFFIIIIYIKNAAKTNHS